MTTPTTDAREREMRNLLLSHGCCMEDYGVLGVNELIENGRAEYARLLDAYRTAILATERARVKCHDCAELAMEAVGCKLCQEADAERCENILRTERARVRAVVEGMESSCGSGGRNGKPPCCVNVDDLLARLDAEPTP